MQEWGWRRGFGPVLVILSMLGMAGALPSVHPPCRCAIIMMRGLLLLLREVLALLPIGMCNLCASFTFLVSSSCHLTLLLALWRCHVWIFPVLWHSRRHAPKLG